jgi:hypothetical protein
MKTNLILYLILILIYSCKNVSRPDVSNIKADNNAIANQFVDAFYSDYSGKTVPPIPG